ncbi:helix-hairpin-helix domain-containing protein [Sanguibacter sp. A247]|uniref:helix-hairpin-helix domain-containing protein n=1 Tax=unclassified Sanguibacter TaxID=2645534 RepID=UPI003FD8D33E
MQPRVPGQAAAADPDPDDVAALRARLLAGRSDRIVRAHPADHLDPGEPPARGRTAWAVTTRSVVMGVVVIVALAAALIVRALGSEPGDVVHLPAVAASPARGGPLAPAGGEPSSHAGTETAVVGPVVHVVGRVRRPGVVTLGPGARVADAVDAAGGLRKDADVSSVNLARLVTDGEQIVVPRTGDELTRRPDAQAEPGAPQPAGGASHVDINSADAAALDALPGIGPVLAQRIVDHREQHGPFPDVAALSDVSGIGPALEKRLADLVRAG